MAGSCHRIEIDGDGQGRARDFCFRVRLSGEVKYTDNAFNKTVIYKGKARNHLVEQVENFRVGDKNNKREDDLLDTFCYGIALSLGNRDGF